MNPEELTQKVVEVYETLYETTAEYLASAQETAEYERDLKIHINKAVASGEIAGKNQTERDASTQERFSKQMETLDLLKVTEVEDKIALDLARIQVEYVRTLVRLAEIEHGTTTQ